MTGKEGEGKLKKERGSWRNIYEITKNEREKEKERGNYAIVREGERGR